MKLASKFHSDGFVFWSCMGANLAFVKCPSSTGGLIGGGSEWLWSFCTPGITNIGIVHPLSVLLPFRILHPKCTRHSSSIFRPSLSCILQQVQIARDTLCVKAHLIGGAQTPYYLDQRHQRHWVHEMHANLCMPRTCQLPASTTRLRSRMTP